MAAQFLPYADAPPSQRPSWHLEWTAPAECPDADAVRSEVTRLTAAPNQDSRHLKARGVIQRAESGGEGGPQNQDTTWTLSLSTEFEGATGERTLTGSSCESLAHAAALTLAIILNPGLWVTEPPPARHERPPPLPSPAPPKDRPRLRWQAGAYAGMQKGVLGGLSSSFSLSMGVALDSLSLRLTPGVSPPQDVIAFAATKAGGRLWGGSAAGLGCWGASFGPVTLSPCVGLDLTMLHGGGLGVQHPRDATVYWTGVELAGLVGLHVSRSALIEWQAMGLAPFARPSLYLDGIGVVSRPTVVGFRAYGGLAWVFD